MSTPPPPNPKIQLSILIPVLAIILVFAFWVLSGFYFADKRKSLLGEPITDEHISTVRWAFIKMIALSAGIATGAAWFTKHVSHSLILLFGLISGVGAVYAFRGDTPGTLPAAMCLMAVLLPLLAWRSFVGSRGAWAFLVAICFSMALIMFFAAPKVRAKLDISLWYAMGIPMMLMITGIALVTLRSEYRQALR